MSKFDFGTDSINYTDGSLDVEASVEKFRELLTAWAEESSALRGSVAEEVDALFAKRPNARISSEEITMTVCVALGATGGDGLRKTGEAIQAYLKGSGRYNSRRGPGGGWARNSAE
jgi:hypothetical protein